MQRSSTDCALAEWLRRALTGAPSGGDQKTRSVDEQVREAKANALAATPEAIQFMN
ncbi:MAG TPA: hypothetical protein PK970_07835 [Hyphomicrobiaceae bacterium]|nr:hypothetical protein [Hyphomicrobiaceae bacterium]